MSDSIEAIDLETLIDFLHRIVLINYIIKNGTGEFYALINQLNQSTSDLKDAINLALPKGN